MYSNPSRLYSFSRVFLLLAVILAASGCQAADSSVVGRILYNEDYRHEADQVLEGNIRVYPDQTRYLHYTGSFTAFTSELRSDQRRVYGFFFLNDLANAYEDTGNADYLHTGMAMIRQFESEAEENQDTEMMWRHGETLSRRLKHYLRFYTVAKDALSSEDEALVKEAMHNLAHALAYTDLWSGLNNHGMFEDMAVMQYARYTDDPDMYRHAVARIVTYFAKYFDADGVQLENSPEYHMVIVEELKAFLEQADPKHTEGYAVLQEKYEKSHVFSNMVLLPDGTLPNIGDTKRMPIDLTEYYPEMPALSFEQELVRHSFYHAGYAIVKNENSYLLFRAGYILDDHHHNDDLSFWLYKNGDIVSEVGPFGYEYTNPYSEYVRSFAAHNSLLVDGENTINEAGEVVLLDSGHANTMQGKTTRIQGVEWTRAIRYNENFTEITLQDTVHSTDAKEHSYQLLFHLHPGISLQERADGEGYDLRRQDTVIGRFFTDATVSLTEDVYFDNYYVPGEKAQVIVLENNAQDWTANTRIELYP